MQSERPLSSRAPHILNVRWFVPGKPLSLSGNLLWHNHFQKGWRAHGDELSRQVFTLPFRVILGFSKISISQLLYIICLQTSCLLSRYPTNADYLWVIFDLFSPDTRDFIMETWRLFFEPIFIIITLYFFFLLPTVTWFQTRFDSICGDDGSDKVVDPLELGRYWSVGTISYLLACPRLQKSFVNILLSPVSILFDCRKVPSKWTYPKRRGI